MTGGRPIAPNEAWAFRVEVGPRVGVERVGIPTLRQCDLSDADATSFEEALAQAEASRQSSGCDVLGEAVDLAREIYRAEGVACGESRWVWNRGTEDCRRAAEVTNAEVDEPASPWVKICEESLWQYFGKPEYGRASAAGETLRHADAILGIQASIAAGGIGADPKKRAESLAVLANALLIHARGLMQSYYRMVSLYIPQEQTGKTAVELIQNGIKQVNGPKGRRARWEREFLPVAREYCETRTVVSYGALVRLAQDWARERGRSFGPPHTDEALTAGIKRLHQTGELVIPGKSRG